MTSSKDVATTAVSDDKDRDETEDDLENAQVKFILIEIVSALRVPSMDARSDGDPFVAVYMDDGDQEIHRTHVIHNTTNPIWSIETGSLFLLQVPPDSNKESTVSFVLKDYAAVRKAPTLGATQIRLKDLMKGKGKRLEYSLTIPKEVLDYNRKRQKKVAKKAKLVLRFKSPTEEEVEFIQTVQQQNSGIFADEAYLPPSQSKTKQPQIKGWGAEILDTARDSQTDGGIDALLQSALKPSEQWIDVGSGHQGRVYVEVIGCNDLPNLDAATIKSFNNLTDPYCCLIMEDAIVNTSIQKDTLSPRWMPEDLRAFVFHIHHPSSQLYIGVFDRDKTNRVGNTVRQWVHDPIGRILVNLTHFHPNTVYNVQYHLYLVDSSEGRKREEQTPNGTIILRIRIEWDDENPLCCYQNDTRNMLMAGILPPAPAYVAIPDKNDFLTAHYVISGEVDWSSFSMTTITNHIQELKGYIDEDMIELLINALLTVFLWRGHYAVELCWCKKKIKLPLHSIVAFTWGILVTQNYNRIVSLLLFNVAWFFLATMEHRNRHPSPWQQCKSYGELISDLLIGTFCGCCSSSVMSRDQVIEANENLPEIQRYYAAVKERKIMKAEQKDVAITRSAEKAEEELQTQAEMDAAAEAEIGIATSKKDSLLSAVNPLKPILHPVQKILHQICVLLRVIKSIVTWEENYYSFWIVTASLLASALMFFIRWGWVFRWCIRLAVWVLLGPWMKLVDWFYFGRRQNMSDEEKKQLEQEQLRHRYQQSLADHLVSQKRKEHAVKLRGMMRKLFGQHVLRVPRFRRSQFLDYPLPASTAEPFLGEEEVTTAGQICGQKLTGDMIPSRMIPEHPFAHEPLEKQSSSTKVPNLLSGKMIADETKPLLLDKLNDMKQRVKTKKKKFGLFRKWKK